MNMDIKNAMVRATEVAEILKALGYDAEATTVNKNGNEIVGITMGTGGNIKMNIYPRFDSDDINGIIKEVISQYEYRHSDEMDAYFNNLLKEFLDYDKVKGNIIPYLCKGVMKDVVTRKYLDLNVYYKFLKDDFSITIKKSHLDTWKITETELDIQATLNVKDKFEVTNIFDVISVPDIGMFMKVISRGNPIGSTYGSGALLFPELFANIDDGKDLAILPSSVHELIVIKPNDTDGKMMAEMIQSVNASGKVSPDELMSDHPYYYSEGVIKEG